MYLPNSFVMNTFVRGLDYANHLQYLMEEWVKGVLEITYDVNPNPDVEKPFISLNRDKELSIFLPAAHLFSPSEADKTKLRKKGFTKLTVGDFDNNETQTYDLIASTTVSSDTLAEAA